MKKILINFPTLGKSGVDAPRLLKFRALNSLGCELHLFSGLFTKKIEPAGKDVYSFNETVPEFKALSDPKVTKVGFMFWALGRNLKTIFFWREITRGYYDVIYSPAAVLDLTIFPYFYKLFHKNIKWVVVFDNIVPFRDPGNKITRFLAWLFFKISLFFLKKYDRIFVISKDLQEYLLKKGFDEKRVILSANGIDNELIKKARADERYNFEALFLGRINETKGIYDMLEVLDIVRKKYPSFQLAIMGEGDKTTKSRFKKRAKEMGLENNVQFLGYKTGLEKFNIMKSSKCFWFLSVSKSESFGVALLEAVCSGLPAFAYNLPQFAWLYPNGEINISPIGNYELVAQKVIRLFKSGNFRNEKGEKLLGKYSWEKVAEIEYDAIKNVSP